MAKLETKTVERMRAVGELLGPKVNDALVAWVKQPRAEREAPIEYLEEEARHAGSICAHGDPYADQWKRENDRLTTLLRALGEALGLP